MATIDQQLTAWDQAYPWPEDGDVWSERWGSSTAEWYCTLLPRIQTFLPTGTILEIGPGHGRWTHFLRALCKRLIIVDISPNCIDACKRRFSSDTHIEYYVNDGTSLEMISDRSVNFIFSFDSLVHAEAEVMKSYLTQMSAKLTDDGSGFIHHSNLGAFPRLQSLMKMNERLRLRGRLTKRLRKFLKKQDHWRARSMKAGLFRTFSADAGLSCIRQELIGWVGSRYQIDCLSTFKKSAEPGRQCVIVQNPNFMQEAAHARWISNLYELR